MTRSGHKPGPRRGRHRNTLIILVASAVLLAVNGLLLATVRQPGLPVGFAFGVATLCLLAVAVLFAAAGILRPAAAVISSVVRSAWRGALRDRYAVQASRQHPAFAGWLCDRVSTGKPAGIILTTGIASAVVLTSAFVSLAKDVLLRDEIVDLDQFLIHTAYGLRSDFQTEFFKIMTFTAGIEGVLVFALVLVLLAWRQRAVLLAFGLALTLAVAITQLLKIVFGRLRPEEALRLVVEHGFSFPSGHTFIATVLYGLAGYLLFRTSATLLARFAAVAGAVTATVMVGLSRIYLGVHFPSDVLASMLFASAILVLVITVLEINERFRLRPAYTVTGIARLPVLTACAATLLAGVVWNAL